MDAGCFIHLVSVKLNVFVKEYRNFSSVFIQRSDKCKRVSYGVINNGNCVFHSILKRDQVFIRNGVVCILPILRFCYNAQRDCHRKIYGVARQQVRRCVAHYYQCVHVLNLSIMLQCRSYLLPHDILEVRLMLYIESSEVIPASLATAPR